MRRNFFIGETDFRVWLPEVAFIEKSGDAHNSRRISGVMSTERRDRQGETLLAKGLDFDDFLRNGHFNDNHSQATSAIVGYPERVDYHDDLTQFGMPNVEGWTCEGYVLKGTERADGIWELAKALNGVPNRKLGFSVEGKVVRRSDKTIEKAKIRNVAITNCPVNTDCTWQVLAKSFAEPEIAMKSMTAGYGAAGGAATQSGGSALQTESLDSDVKDVNRKKKRKEALMRAIAFDEIEKAMDIVLDKRPEWDEETAAVFVKHLFSIK